MKKTADRDFSNFGAFYLPVKGTHLLAVVSGFDIVPLGFGVGEAFGPVVARRSYESCHGRTGHY
jgi:hypothetical protein